MSRIPCARCERLELNCSVDPTYKRTNKHDQVDELQQQVQRLQGVIKQQLDGKSAGVADSAAGQGSTAERVLGTDDSQHLAFTQTQTLTESVLETHAPPPEGPPITQGNDIYRLGCISISLEKSQDLFAM